MRSDKGARKVLVPFELGKKKKSWKINLQKAKDLFEPSSTRETHNFPS